MKIGIFSDIHLHKHNSFSGSDGRQRLRDGLGIIEHIVNLLVEKRCDALIFLGDFFHIRRVMDVEVFNEVDHALTLLPLGKIIHKIAISGNHDWYSSNCDYTSIGFLRHHGFKVIQKSTVFIEDGIEMVLVPWQPTLILQETLDNIPYRSDKAESSLLFVHTIPFGSSSATGHIFNSGVDLRKYSSRFDVIFCGDIHKRQLVGQNIVVCGSPMQLNFADIGQECGIHIFNGNSKSWKFCSMKGKYPEFIEVNTNDPSTIDPANYYRVITSFPDRFEKLNNIQIVHKRKFVERKRADITPLTVPGKAVEEYVKKFGSGFDVDRLIDIGRRAIS